MNAKFPDQKTLLVRCRLIPDFNLCVAISAAFALFLMGLAITQPFKPSEVEAFALAMSMTLPAPLYWLIARIRGATVLDESGVRWRTAFSGWKSARWDEIESCDMRATSNTTHWKFVVSTLNGAFSWTQGYQNSSQIAPFAARFCPLIPSQIENWPRFFGSDSFENRVMPLVCFPVLGGYLFWVVWKLISSPPRYWATQISYVREISGWPLAIFAVVAGVTLMVVLPALMLLVFWDGWKRNFPRRAEFFIATLDGVTYHLNSYYAPHQPLFVPWSELQHLHVESRWGAPGLAKRRLETARGELHWNSALQGWAEFDQMLYQHAPQLQRTTARNLRMSFSDAPPESETMVFDFKTREARAMLCLTAFATLMSLGFAILGPPPSEHESAPPWVFALAFLVSGAMTAYGIALFRHGTIRVDARGIEWKIPLKNRFLSWSEIQEIGVGRNSFLRVGGKKLPLILAPFPAAHFELFLKEIQSRTTKASRGSDEIFSQP